MSAPSKWIVPAAAGTRPTSARASVLLPAPFDPSRAVTLPRAAVNDRPPSATALPYLTRRPRTSSKTSAGEPAAEPTAKPAGRATDGTGPATDGTGPATDSPGPATNSAGSATDSAGASSPR